jgi:hypothetical protein
MGEAYVASNEPGNEFANEFANESAHESAHKYAEDILAPWHSLAMECCSLG